MGSVQFGTGEAPLRRVIGAQPDDRLLAASSRQMHNPCATLATPAVAQTSMSSSGQTYKNGSTKGASPGRRYPERAERQIPTCIRRLGTIAIVDPDNQWWRELNLGSPEAIIKVFVQQSGCFSLLNRGRAMQSRATERAVADNAEL